MTGSVELPEGLKWYEGNINDSDPDRAVAMDEGLRFAIREGGARWCRRRRVVIK